MGKKLEFLWHNTQLLGLTFSSRIFAQMHNLPFRQTLAIQCDDPPPLLGGGDPEKMEA
jgi:hypothetical protein